MQKILMSLIKKFQCTWWSRSWQWREINNGVLSPMWQCRSVTYAVESISIVRSPRRHQIHACLRRLHDDHVLHFDGFSPRVKSLNVSTDVKACNAAFMMSMASSVAFSMKMTSCETLSTTMAASASLLTNLASSEATPKGDRTPIRPDGQTTSDRSSGIRDTLDDYGVLRGFFDDHGGLCGPLNELGVLRSLLDHHAEVQGLLDDHGGALEDQVTRTPAHHRREGRRSTHRHGGTPENRGGRTRGKKVQQILVWSQTCKNTIFQFSNTSYAFQEPQNKKRRLFSGSVGHV